MLNYWVRFTQMLKLTLSESYFIPIQRPTLFRRPDLVVGIPVAFAIERFTFVTPSARFHEKVRPGPSFIKPPGRNSNLDLVENLRLTLVKSLFLPKELMDSRFS